MNILTADIGSTYTKLTAIDTAKKEIVATSSAFTTIDTNVEEGFTAAYNKLKRQAGAFRYDELLCCSSAAGGLKMVSLGLVPELTAKAAKLAAASAGAKVVKTYAFEISQAEQAEIFDIRPDLVLLCGGTDGGNKEVILANARRLCQVGCPFTVVVAGNKCASFELEEIFRASGKPFVITENVMPEFNRLNIEPARRKIKELFISRIIEAKGLSRIQEMCKTDIIPTPLAVLNACELLSKGTKNMPGLGDLLAVDIGGATTDVYSISDGRPTLENVTVKGLPEPISKRTVEGDLGMRYSLPSLVDELDLDAFSKELSIDRSEVIDWVKTCTQHPGLLAEAESREQKIEELIARNAVKIAVERHAGTYQPVYTPFGQVYTLTGKDLAAVPFVIGIGGVVINARRPHAILEGAKRQPDDHVFAKPEQPGYLIDKKYIFASMGLLGSAYPDLALELMKKETINLTHYGNFQ